MISWGGPDRRVLKPDLDVSDRIADKARLVAGQTLVSLFNHRALRRNLSWFDVDVNVAEERQIEIMTTTLLAALRFERHACLAIVNSYITALDHVAGTAFTNELQLLRITLSQVADEIKQRGGVTYPHSWDCE
jgi:hypothetical protein